jgi:hypothetical protein
MQGRWRAAAASLRAIVHIGHAIVRDSWRGDRFCREVLFSGHLLCWQDFLCWRLSVQFCAPANTGCLVAPVHIR